MSPRPYDLLFNLVSFNSISASNQHSTILHSGMCKDLRPPAAMPNRQQSSTIAALVLDVFEPGREVGNATAAKTETA